MSKDNILKVLGYFIPLSIIVVFLVTLASGGYLQTHSEAGKQISGSIDQIEKLVKNESWEEAISENMDLQSKWKTLNPIIQISTNEEDIREFSRAMVRLEGYLKGREQGSALAEIGILRFTWVQLEN